MLTALDISNIHTLKVKTTGILVVQEPVGQLPVHTAMLHFCMHCHSYKTFVGSQHQQVGGTEI